MNKNKLDSLLTKFRKAKEAETKAEAALQHSWDKAQKAKEKVELLCAEIGKERLKQNVNG